MKDFDPLQPLPDKTEQVVQFPKSVQYLPPVRRPHKGLKMWSVGYKTIEEIKPTISSMPVKTYSNGLKNQVIHHEVAFDPKRYYCWAINKRKAWDKFLKANNFDPKTPMPDEDRP